MVFTTIQIQVFMLIFARVAAMLVQIPIIGDRTVNRSVRMILCVGISMLVWNFIRIDPQYLPPDSFLMLMALGREALIGWCIGTAARFVFDGVEAAGELMGSQMGLSAATMFNPALGTQTVITATLLRQMVLIIFLILNGHHLLLSALVKSFDVLGLGLAPLNMQQTALYLIDMGRLVFEIGVALAGPVMLIIFLLDFSLGLISRVSPQVNVFQLGFQIKPVLGMYVVMITLPHLVERIQSLIGSIMQDLSTIISLLH